MILRSTAALASFALFFTILPAAQAQTPAASVEDGSSATLWQLNTDGGLQVLGTFGTGAIPATGAGVRLMWHPAKAAFRAGSVDGTQWDDANVSAYSVALGFNTTASGFASAAMGHTATASGLRSVALGSSATASGFSSLALGNSTTASGNYSAAMGRNTTAQASNSLVAGRYNVIGGDQINWVVTDPLFVVGNGDSNANRSNALTLFKDGGLVVGGALGTGAIPEEGAGARLMWYPAKAAFRVGSVSGTQWDDANVNTYSVALGLNTTASGQYATAMGNGTTASGLASTAMGWFATASGRISAAMGESTTAQAYA
ncbi:MAG: hypothetical protein R3247_02065, partial [Rhodothermales bacterium]|nr:hypothetical protein [Rhodothermales bacterium]